MTYPPPPALVADIRRHAVLDGAGSDGATGRVQHDGRCVVYGHHGPRVGKGLRALRQVPPHHSDAQDPARGPAVAQNLPSRGRTTVFATLQGGGATVPAEGPTPASHVQSVVGEEAAQQCASCIGLVVHRPWRVCVCLWGSATCVVVLSACRSTLTRTFDSCTGRSTEEARSVPR